MSRPRSSPSSLLVGLLLVGLLLGAGCRRRPEVQPVESDRPAPPVKILYPTAPGSFVKIVDGLKRSLVHLATTTPVRGGPADWFPAGSPTQPSALSDRVQRSLGTGFIIDESGGILTNAHVVAKAGEIRVELHDGTTGVARLVGPDPKSDLALLKFDPPAGTKLTPARLGDSDALQLGEWVVALGNPFGLGPTASAGIVSAKERLDAVVGQQSNLGLIQTDVAVNAGNSGGPLVNTIGEVVGIATALETETTGIGFAVPINLAKRILPMLRRDGRVVRAWVGIYMDQVSAQRASEAGLKQASGALVTSVVPRGPAERAGLRAGDIILSFANRPVLSAQELPWVASLVGVDRQVPVRVWRDGRSLSFTLKTERMPE